MLRDHLSHSSAAIDAGGSGISPGKRTLTQSLAPVQRSLRDEQRAVVGFDDATGDDYYEARATVEARPSADRLTDRQIRRARRKNPEWVARLKVSAQIFSTADVDSSAFALDVAGKQAEHRLAIDGIAGPKTVAAVAGAVAAARSGRRSGAVDRRPREVVDFDAAVGDDLYDARATVEPHDDPFGLHLLAQAGG